MPWFAKSSNRSSNKDRRSAERYRAPQLAAYYWNGDHAQPHSVRDISSSGTYLLTEDRWHAGTLLMVTIQKSVTANDTRPSRSIRVQSKVIRAGTDGVGFAFVFPDTADARKGGASFQGDDQNALIAFSHWVRHG